MEAFLIQGWGLITSGCDGTSTLSGAETFAERLHEPCQSEIRNQPVSVRFPHLTGRY